jgi:hypothetical protein
MDNSAGSTEKGISQSEAVQILTLLRDRAFESSDEKLALALGRPTEEVEAWTAGSAAIDEDALMKAKGIAMQRGVQIE